MSSTNNDESYLSTERRMLNFYKKYLKNNKRQD